MTIGYGGYIMMVTVAALAASGLACALVWFLGPVLLARARGGAPPEEAPLPAALPEQAPRGPRFDFTPEQAPALAELLGRESGDDVGVVLWHLPAPAARALLAALPAARRAGALLGMAAPRDVDAEFVRAVRAELENRLYGRVGGAQEAAALALSLPYGERKALLEAACAADPARAAGLRALVLLDEDLLELGESGLAALAAAVPPREMARFLPALPAPLREKVRAAYPPKAAAALDKAPERADGKEAGLGEFLALVEKISAEGLMARPKPKAPPAAPAAPAAAARPKDDDWG